MKAVIVDDEQDSRNILATYVGKYCPDVTVVATADSVATGLTAIREHKPEIVFLDIEMPYGNGFDLLDQVGEVFFETVFVTAFDQYAIRALNQSASYYLLKPIDIEELIRAVQKIREERSKLEYVEHARVLRENRLGGPQKIMLPTMEGFEVVDISSIVYCEAVDNFTRFYFEAGPPLMICRTLKYFEDVLKDFRFIRIHRSYLINPDYVLRYNKGKGGSVTMKNNQELEISANRKQEFLDGFTKA